MDELEIGPRWDENAEQTLLGSAMSNNPRNLGELAVRGEDFYRPAHEQLWDLMMSEARAGRPTTPIAISHRLASDPIKGVDAAYLHRCAGTASSTAVAGYYADVVAGLARLRRMAEVGATLIQTSRVAAYDQSAEAVDKGRSILDGVMASAVGIRTRSFAQALESAVEEWDAPKRKGYPTGWSDLDRKLNGGWHPGQCTVIGARPAVGKSVIAACAAVAAHRYGAGFFSLEMSELEVVSRMAAAAQGIDLGRLNAGKLTDDDWAKIRRLAVRSQQWPVFIEDKSRLTMAQIRATVRTWSRKVALPLVIIDYSQLVTPADRSEARERQVSRILEDCKHLAKEFDTHVLALAQVNRGSTQREDKRPTMSDLRESGGIEAHADNIILLHRDDDEMEGEIELIIAKNRHGETGKLRLAWRPAFASANGLSSQAEDYRYGMDVPA
ncbi:DnaB-like helicase C-terminal domain-containing protein [Arthrobacter agilis]|uniref:replicative DNA helicase n=1 Tax=Arthrobacter agilis TaxID=37921 RepID=UPI002365C56E|nr:DnaB-like helicase C-terminal domain-containing protein [Arthrobacter agilis]WDF34563.1 DnaB-like helicase C-terminal domain-containing protein [Arthrobacter agilis]